MRYSFSPIALSITIAITFFTCITASILYQRPSPSPSCLSHALQLQSYNNVHHHRHDVYHVHYSFDPITMSITSITIAITSNLIIITFITKNNVLHFHRHRHHVYHKLYSFSPITMSIPNAITSITSITASIL